MKAAIRFSLPPGLGIADMPPTLRALIDGASGGTVTLHSPCPIADLEDLARWARRRGFELRDLEVRPPTLEDVYLQIIEREEERRCC